MASWIRIKIPADTFHQNEKIKIKTTTLELETLQYLDDILMDVHRLEADKHIELQYNTRHVY